MLWIASEATELKLGSIDRSKADPCSSKHKIQLNTSNCCEIKCYPDFIDPAMASSSKSVFSTFHIDSCQQFRFVIPC